MNGYDLKNKKDDCMCLGCYAARISTVCSIVVTPLVHRGTWVYFETDKPKYFWENKQISVTVYETIRLGQSQKIETFLIGPIEDSDPDHRPRTDKPILAELGRCEFPEVGCF